MSSHDPITSMWAEALAILEEAERTHRQYFRLIGTQTRGPVWEPPVDVFEADRELLIVIALPGVTPDSVRVIIDGGGLLVTGERPVPGSTRAEIRRLEIPYGRFERYIDLPPGLFEVARRDLVNGCLLLSLHKLDRRGRT